MQIKVLCIRIFTILSFCLMLSSASACDLLSPSKCNSCKDLENAINYKKPNEGEFLSGAYRNGLYASYLKNCPLLAAKLIKAGANPSVGGFFSSMILTVSNKWPHNDLKINEAWASLLYISGASIKEPLYGIHMKSTRYLLKNELDYYKPDYPIIFELFER